jgi:hypothetical protein
MSTIVLLFQVLSGFSAILSILYLPPSKKLVNTVCRWWNTLDNRDHLKVIEDIGLLLLLILVAISLIRK